MADSECISGLISSCRNKQSQLDVNLESNLFTKLSEELLAEILVRLPTIAAARFQVVCKLWYSIISSPYFIARFIHLRHHIDVRSSLVLQNRYYCDDDWNCNCQQYHSEFHIISDSSLLRNVYGDRLFCLSFLPFSPVELSNVRLEGSFEDLILCSYFTCTRETNYYVTNLLTKQWIALPPAPVLAEFMGFPSVGFLCVPPPCSESKPGDNSLYKFMVVRLCTGKPNVPCSRFKVQVLSSEDCQWRTLDVSSSLTLKHHGSMTSLVAYRGMLHWLNFDCIVVYDPLNTLEIFSRVIHLPIQLPPVRSLDKTSWFGVCHDHLRVVEVSAEDAGDPLADVWELEDYDSGLWNLVHKVYLKNLTYIGLPITEKSLQSTLFPFLVLSFHPTNGDVVYLQIGNGVATVNMKSKIMERYYPLRKEQRICRFCWVDVFHLTDQWWPTQVSSLRH